MYFKEATQYLIREIDMLDKDDIAFLQQCLDKVPMTGIQVSAKAVQLFQKLEQMKQGLSNGQEEVVSE